MMSAPVWGREAGSRGGAEHQLWAHLLGDEVERGKKATMKGHSRWVTQLRLELVALSPALPSSSSVHCVTVGKAIFSLWASVCQCIKCTVREIGKL